MVSYSRVFESRPAGESDNSEISPSMDSCPADYMGCFEGVKSELSQIYGCPQSRENWRSHCANELDKLFLNERLKRSIEEGSLSKQIRRKDNGDVETGRDRYHCGQGMEL